MITTNENFNRLDACVLSLIRHSNLPLLMLLLVLIAFPGKGFGLSSSRNVLVKVNEIRFSGESGYERVVIELDTETTYKEYYIKEDPSIKKPPRFYIDVFNATISDLKERSYKINNSVVKTIRAAQNKKDIVRVVLDLHIEGTYKVFTLTKPFRIVADLTDGTKKFTEATRASSETTSTDPQRLSKSSSNPATKSQKPKGLVVVLDPGHGGKDGGAKGPSGLLEKDVVLSIAKKVNRELESKAGYKVYMTRNDDTYISLEDRGSFANSKEADLFVSIHANASLNRKACGIETYFLSPAKDKEAMMVAARENAVSNIEMDDLQIILSDLMLYSKVNESSLFAGCIQRDIIKNLNGKYSRVKDNGVKQAPFYVLCGTKMPAVLIEVSFISNPREEKKLRSPAFQREIAQSIVKGIIRYVDNYK
ncbi:MAG: N-acetylmuramoyl-L-alanine amidase [Thermodesulfobacteriota bacterium]|nr:N-acetylmuramoyl-L-alanine amidase [Thermodesulfobacteriota bacterium]